MTTAEQHDNKLREAQDNLEEMVTRLLEDDDAIRNWLLYSGRMHNYSANNMMLILFDYMNRGYEGPILTMGYKGWKDVGRTVKKGSKAITLLKPVMTRWKSWEEQPGPNSIFDAKMEKWFHWAQRLDGFDIINKTFHIQDTDGPEYTPPAPIPIADSTTEAFELLHRLEGISSEIGVSNVTYGPMRGGTMGYYTRDSRSIVLKTEETPGQSCKTLVHEYGHHVAYELGFEHHEYYSEDRDAAETAVEGASFMVMAYLNFDTSQYSVPYVAGWAGDMDIVKGLFNDMRKIAKVIIDKLEK